MKRLLAGFTARSIRHASLAGLLLIALQPSYATFKCTETGGRIIYTDVACFGGRQLPVTDLREPATLQADRIAAVQRAAGEKAQLDGFQALRWKSERANERQRQRTASTTFVNRKKCAGLALRKKWLQEDVIVASRKTSARKKQKFSRLTEKFTLECSA